MLCPRTICVYPSPPLQTLPPYTLGLLQYILQHTLHILGLQHTLHMQHRFTFIWFNPNHPLMHLNAHTHRQNAKKSFLSMNPCFILRWSTSERVVPLPATVPFPKCAQATIQQYKPPIKSSQAFHTLHSPPQSHTSTPSTLITPYSHTSTPITPHSHPSTHLTPYRPKGLAKCVERPSPILVERAIQTYGCVELPWLSQTSDLDFFTCLFLARCSLVLR